jgi:hypothetical protein
MDANQIKITVALVAAASAVAVAIVQVFAQRKNANALEQLKLRLDRQRAEHGEYLKAHMKLVLDGQEQQLQAFRIILQRVQLLRDKIRGVVSDLDAYSPEILHDEIQALVDGVIQAFAEHQMALTGNGRKLAHTLKNASLVAVRDMSALPVTGKQRRDFIEKIGRLEEDLKGQHAALREEALSANARIVDSIQREIAAGDQ